MDREHDFEYDFESDQRYQDGLKAIKQVDCIETRKFYYEKYLMNEKKEVKDSSLLNPAKREENKTLTFQDMMKKISKGERIEGIQKIEEKELGMISAESIIKPIKKPWE